MLTPVLAYPKFSGLNFFCHHFLNYLKISNVLGVLYLYMIISHKHRFIFLHCRKTGGSSIKVSLYPQLGRQDIMIGSFHELIRDKQQLKMQAISDIVSPSGSTMLLLKLAKTRRIDVSINDAIKSKYNFLGSNPPHASAKLIRENFPAQWQNYQKFAFVRNPYTQIVSDFLWRKKKDQV